MREKRASKGGNTCTVRQGRVVNLIFAHTQLQTAWNRLNENKQRNQDILAQDFCLDI